MRVLVTGVTGQVGRALLGALAPVGSLIPADRSKLDLTRLTEIGSVLDGFAADMIVNPAAYTAVDLAEDERDLAFRINAEAPGVIARWAASHGIPLIHFSTDYVFDGRGERPWCEDDPTNPLSVYGASKLAGEEAVRSAGGPHLIVRTSWVYAASGRNFLRTMVRLASERDTLRVVADQFGAPTSADLIATAIADIVGAGGEPLAERFAGAGGLVNLSASGDTSWHGFAGAIVAGLKARGIALSAERIIPIATTDYPTKAKRPSNSRLDLTRLKSVFGIEPRRWDEALAQELDRLAVELTSSQQR